MTHTPGPWFVETKTSGRGISMGVKTVSGKYIASTGDHFVACGGVHPQFTSSENYEDNANLIAAAPQLLQALKESVERIQEWSIGADIPVDLDAALAAIAKAEGRQ